MSETSNERFAETLLQLYGCQDGFEIDLEPQFQSEIVDGLRAMGCVVVALPVSNRFLIDCSKAAFRPIGTPEESLKSHPLADSSVGAPEALLSALHEKQRHLEDLGKQAHDWLERMSVVTTYIQVLECEIVEARVKLEELQFAVERKRDADPPLLS